MHHLLHSTYATLVGLCLIGVARAHEHAHHDAPSTQLEVNEQMRQAAIDFLAALPPETRGQTTFPFDSAERTGWNFVPMERSGTPLKAMTLEQRRAARRLMRSALSDKGYLKATTIMSLEQVLRLIEADRENVEGIRDQEKYWFGVFGDPAGEGPWGWRVEGHHLSLNFTSDGRLVVSATPLFLGANPHEVRVGPRIGLRALGEEEDNARQLMASLSEEQRDKVIIQPAAPRDVHTLPGAPIDLGAPAGLALADMTPKQQTLLKTLVRDLVQHLRPELANEELRAIEQAGYGKLHFAWAGGLGPDDNHYFRVHGPTLVLEYDNAQGNHSHLVWHSTENDFGLDSLQKHYERHHLPAVAQ
ncbi:hypothetical protein KOR34_14130 [Posidoniimonas corsicana]|uniref:DUF3500 domain-containing protein n=1 Tax=Posidoniimonas corsicana TaxID=1938618 RepID=A0A5C5VF01_9BACT|nr:DUF3500 domain-containing protein [Posidoniimonas corsicana]TWT36507.1 hypothetical protein KOR34_14130 [Posidoniimonas corsicana]